jgi:hypothetical protein
MLEKKLSDMKLNIYLKKLNLLELEKDYVDEFTSYYKPLFLKEAGNNGYEIPIASANTETSCNTRVEKSYEVSDEEQLRLGFMKLTEEVIQITSNLFEKVKEKTEKQIELEVSKQVLQANNQALKQLANELDIFFDLNF